MRRVEIYQSEGGRKSLAVGCFFIQRSRGVCVCLEEKVGVIVVELRILVGNMKNPSLIHWCSLIDRVWLKLLIISLIYVISLRNIHSYMLCADKLSKLIKLRYVLTANIAEVKRSFRRN